MIAAKEREMKKESISPRFAAKDDKGVYEGERKSVKKGGKNNRSNGNISVELVGVADLREKGVK